MLPNVHSLPQLMMSCARLAKYCIESEMPSCLPWIDVYQHATAKWQLAEASEQDSVHKVAKYAITGCLASRFLSMRSGISINVLTGRPTLYTCAMFCHKWHDLNAIRKVAGCLKAKSIPLTQGPICQQLERTGLWKGNISLLSFSII